MDDLRSEFLLESDVVFLNHGSYGATPKPVFDEYQRWQRRLEAQPVRFFAQELTGALAEARHALAAFLNVGGDDLVFIPNATFGANLVARSLELEPGDEVLTCDHEYGACSNAWRYVLDRRGAGYVHQPLDLPVTDAESIADAIWAGVTPRTRVLYLSHITSPTALILPVAELCRRARGADPPGLPDVRGGGGRAPAPGPRPVVQRGRLRSREPRAPAASLEATGAVHASRGFSPRRRARRRRRRARVGCWRSW